MLDGYLYKQEMASFEPIHTREIIEKETKKMCRYKDFFFCLKLLKR
jgi:hypothetical protein